jgi:hypothetical protein
MIRVVSLSRKPQNRDFCHYGGQEEEENKELE